MGLATGAKLGPYEIVAPLGAGGMGEVYRARDTRLLRDVAVKVLPPSLAADADRLRRFEQEARATGVLNHPNILAVHDIGAHEGAPYVVSELLEGETLRERINGTPLPVRKAIDFAAQIARGLAAAHEKGVVHRDLKPDNLIVTKDGRVKILDFGLAKLVGVDALTEAETNSADMPHGTDAGTVLGTAGYMSPEQVRAQPVDHRSDIFSFGSVLYEMLSGRRAFRGASAVETMNAILKEDPPELSETNRHLPPALERIVSHCLEKNPEERFQSARDIAFDLDALSGQSAQTTTAALALGRPSTWSRPAALALTTVAIAAAGFLAGRRGAEPKKPSYTPLTFRRGAVISGRFAPDGRTVIYAAGWEGRLPEVFSTQPGSPESRSLELKDTVLAGVSSTGELAVLLRRSVGPGRTLARVPSGGGAPRDVLDGVNAADWSPDGSSLAAVHFAGSRLRLEYPIGRALYESGAGIAWPRVSPRGDKVAFTYHPVAGDNRGDVAVVDLAGKQATLAPGWEDVGGLAWSPDGREVWFTAAKTGTDRSLWAATLEGHVRPVESVPGHLVLQDIARDGKLLLHHGNRRPVILGLPPGGTQEIDLSWLDYSALADLSTDGKTLLFSEQGVAGGPGYAVYLRGTDGSPAARLGKGSALALSPDGKWALAIDLSVPEFVLLPTGTGEPRTLPRGSLKGLHGAFFFPDGKRLLVIGYEESRGPRLHIQDLAGGAPKPFTPEGVFTDANTLTPDGRFVAAVFDNRPWLYPVSGGDALPMPGVEDGDVPLRWSADGKLLYVRAATPGPARIFRVNAATGRREFWKELAPADMAGVGSVQFAIITPDGKAYAYAYNRGLSSLYLVEGLK